MMRTIFALPRTIITLLAIAILSFCLVMSPQHHVSADVQTDAVSTDAVSATAATTCPYRVSTGAPVGTTSVADVPVAFDTTDGDILASTTFMSGTTHLLVIGGNFSNVITKDGVKHPAKNFAIVSEETGNIAYAGTGINSYVRAVAYGNNLIYVGGDFTTFGGVARNHAAAVITPNGGVSTWNPNMASSVKAIAAGTSAVFIGDGGTLRSVNPTTAATKWSVPAVGGAVQSLLLSPGQSGLYAGGSFEKLGTQARHGFTEVFAANGAPVTAFNPPVLKSDSGVGEKGAWDGEEGLSLAWDNSYNPGRVVLGFGGGTYNGIASYNSATGAQYWAEHTEGDTQGVGVIGNVYITGYHRNHGNNIGCPYPYFSTEFSGANGIIFSYWNPQLSGNQSNADAGNNGVQAITVDKNSKKLFLLGAFTKYGATCNYGPTVGNPVPPCTGGTPRQSIAVFPYK
jgi:hypothetical protein